MAAIPSEYAQYIDYINGSGFFFKDWTNHNLAQNGAVINSYPYGNYSYFSTLSSYNVNNLTQFDGGVSSLTTVYITGNDNDGWGYNVSGAGVQYNYYWYGENTNGLSFRTDNQGNPEWVGAASGVSPSWSYEERNYATLSALFDVLWKRARNCTINVNGEDWDGQITYTWQSVAGVSGKGQTYSLSQIASASINNGESVTGASASAFTSLTAQVSTMVTDDSAMSGADAGGISGSGSNSGNQSSGYAFGQGESGTNVSGGGGGYYGGEKGGSLLSGGAGSGYIGNSLVSNKKMVGYNVPTSSAGGTKTESVNVYSAIKEANKPKAGNGFARIKYLSDGIITFKNAIVFPHDDYEVKGKNTETIYTIAQLKQTFSSNNTFFMLWDTNGYILLPFNASSGWEMKLGSGAYVMDDGREDWLYGMNNATDPLYPCYLSGSALGQSYSIQYKTVNGASYNNDCYTGGFEEHPCIIVSTLEGLKVYKDDVQVR